MADGKTLLKWAAIGVATLVLIRLALWVFGVVISAVIWAIQTAILLALLALFGYGVYWLYVTFVADSDSNATTKNRDRIYER
ncbi:MAG: hypothetical protein ACQETB_03990 [Halobacteriota archaeon]